MLPKSAAKFITNNAKDVKINFEKLQILNEKLIQSFQKCDYSLKTWKTHILNPKVMDMDAISWIFFIDTINFSFWPDNDTEKFTVEYKDAYYTGYWSACAAVNKSVDNGVKVFDASFMKDITVYQFNNIFQSVNNKTIPLVDDRISVLQEAGRVLLDRFGGHFVNCIKEANNSAQTLLQLIVSNFKSYKDEAILENQLVCLYKRAQILIADVWCCFEGESYGKFEDINTLTAFADYRVPQVLAYFGVIEYSQELKEILDKKIKLNNGDRQEIEIRGVTLQCIEVMVDLIREEVKDKDCIVNSILVDNFLWDFRRLNADSIDSVPMHRTRTIYY